MGYFDRPKTEPDPSTDKLVVGDKWMVKVGGIFYERVTIVSIPWFPLMDVRCLDEKGRNIKVSRGSFLRKSM